MGTFAWVAVVTLNDLQLDVYRRLNYADSPATAVTTRITAFLNQRHRQILAMPGMERLRDDNITFASVASTATYAMPPAVARIKTIYDGTTNQLKLTERTVEWLRMMDPRTTSTGTPESWIPLSYKQVQKQPSAACNLHVISTSASDNAGVTCFIEFTRTGGYTRASSSAMNGISDVALTTVGDVIEVDKFYLSAAAVGTVTLLDGLAGNVLATIPIGERYARYQTIQLWPIPSAAVTYNVDYTREIFDMSNTTDEPLLPRDYHWLLSLGARVDEYEKLDDSRVNAARALWEKGISRLRNFVINSPDYVIVPGGGSQRERSNLGSQYPAGSAW